MNPNQIPQVDLKVDVSGKFCPLPVMEVAKAIERLSAGQVVELFATDPGVEADIPAWCKAVRHEFLGLLQEGSFFRVFVRKAERR